MSETIQPMLHNHDPNHRGPITDYRVLTGISNPSEIPADVRDIAEGTLRQMAERALSPIDVTLDDVSFIAEVQDAEATSPPEYPTWLIAAHGPTATPGTIVHSAGSWASASSRTAFGNGRSSTVMSVHIIDRAELTTPTTA